jgi:hypothetical protein
MQVGKNVPNGDQIRQQQMDRRHGLSALQLVTAFSVSGAIKACANLEVQMISVSARPFCLVSTILAMFFGSPRMLAAQAKSGMWHDVYETPGTLGAALETRFGSLLDACQARELESLHVWQKILHKPKSAIPLEIQQALKDEDLQRAVRAVPANATYNLWRYAFDRDTLDVAGFDQNIPGRLMDAIAFGSIALPDSRPGMKYVLHTETCSSVLAAAANAKLEPPGSSLKNAMTADFQSKRNFAMTRGTFRSPFAAMLDDSASPAKRRLALLTAYELYQSDPGASTRPRYYIDQFEGVSLIDLGQTAQSREFSMDASASGNYLVISADGKVHYGANYTANTSFGDFATYVFGTPLSGRPCASNGCIHFLPLPNPGYIAQQLAALTIPIQPIPPPRFSLAAINPVSIGDSVLGIPSNLCGRWQAVSADPKTSVAIHDQSPLQNRDGCYFDFEVTPAQSGANSSQLLTVQFDLLLLEQPQTATAPRLKMTLSLTPMDEPKIQIDDFNKVAIINPGMLATAPPAGFFWDVKTSFYDSGTPVDYGKTLDVNNVSLTCDGGTQPLVSPPAVVSNAADHFFLIRVERPLDKSEVLKGDGRLTTCAVSADVVVTLKPKGTGPAPKATRHLQTNVLMPSISKAVTPSG